MIGFAQDITDRIKMEKELRITKQLTEEIERSLQARRPRPEEVARSPDQHHQVLDHESDAEGQEELQQFMRMIDAPKQRHFDDRAHPGDEQRRQSNSAPEAEAAGKPLGQREAEIGAEHIKGAMSEIDDPSHAKNDRQAASSKKQR